MTESEAKGFIQGKLDCMKKCDLFNKEDNTSDNDCDNCEYCYSQGNFGEQKEAFQMALQALEKQIPKKLINTCQYISGCCPNCKKYISDCLEYNKFMCCPYCGQKLDWSDDVCEWEYDKHFEFAKSKCGSIDTHRIEFNKLKYCPYCGKKIKVVE